MLLKVGAVMMLLSLVLAAGVAATVVLRSEEPAETATLSAETSTAETTATKKRTADSVRKREEGSRKEESATRPAPEPAPEPTPEPAPDAASEPRPEPPLTPNADDWPRPTNDELAVADGPRYYEPTSDSALTLTVEALGLYDVPVISSANLEVLDRGLMHEPETSLPWDGGAQRNVFIAGHYLGYPGTGSRLIFHDLDKLRGGDEIVLKDRQGRIYEYRVSESFTVSPEDSWVMGQMRGRDMVTLQTCTPPTFENRLIVRADRA